MLTTMLVLAVAMLLPGAVAQYLARLPYAPDCPRCQSMTGQRTVPGTFDWLYGLLLATPVRMCRRCGWTGRMRWRLATQRAERRPG